MRVWQQACTNFCTLICTPLLTSERNAQLVNTQLSVVFLSRLPAVRCCLACCAAAAEPPLKTRQMDMSLPCCTCQFGCHPGSASRMCCAMSCVKSLSQRQVAAPASCLARMSLCSKALVFHSVLCTYYGFCIAQRYHVCMFCWGYDSYTALLGHATHAVNLYTRAAQQ